MVDSQLKVSQRAGLAFDEFTEPEIKFPPTYKYKKYTTYYDKKEGKKCRAPAWCDRILYKTGEGIDTSSIQVESYDHIMKLSGSDHKPVFSVMNVQVKDYDMAKLKKTQLRIERELKKTEKADGEVIIDVSETDINFGDLKYKTPESHELTLHNQSEGNVYYHFLPKPEDGHICKRLFNIDKPYGVIQPDETVTITIEAFVDPETAHVMIIYRL